MSINSLERAGRNTANRSNSSHQDIENRRRKKRGAASSKNKEGLNSTDVDSIMNTWIWALKTMVGCKFIYPTALCWPQHLLIGS
jgi:hypothetical protein